MPRNVSARGRTRTAPSSCVIAAAVLLTTSASSARGTDAAGVVDRIDVEHYRHYLDDLMFAHDGDDRSPFGAEHDLARDSIEFVLRGFGLTTALDPFEWQGETFFNVVAVKEGTVTPERQYIIAGHFDARGGPGADDNASACAALLEIARVLSPLQFESTIIFIAFDLEEPSPTLNGSRHYAAAHSGDDIRGMISMDLIAYSFGTGTCDIYGRSASNQIKFALRDAVARYSNGLTATVYGPLDRSDHAPFEWEGKPACWLIEALGPDANPCYHRPCDSVDTPEYLDYDYAIQLVRSVTGYLVEQAGLIPGDVDGDGDVDFDDLLLVLASWGRCPGGCRADLNRDGVVDVADLLIVLGNWG